MLIILVVDVRQEKTGFLERFPKNRSMIYFKEINIGWNALKIAFQFSSSWLSTLVAIASLLLSLTLADLFRNRPPLSLTNFGYFYILIILNLLF